MKKLLSLLLALIVTAASCACSAEEPASASDKEAIEAALQTVKGAAALLDARGSHPEAEIDRVTTPGGITIRGLNAMEEAWFTAAVIAGLKA